MSLPAISRKLRRLHVGGAACLFLVAAAGCQTAPATPPATDAQRAEQEFESAVDRAPTPNTLYAMSRILAAQHRDIECEAILAKIIRERPDYMSAYNDLAELQMRQRRLDDAMATLHAGLKVSARQPVLLNNLGMCRIMRSEYDEALQSFTHAAALAPDDTRFRANMAVALGLLGRYDEALALYEQVGSPADAHYNLGVLAESRKDHARARTEFALAKTLKAESDARNGAHKTEDIN